MSHLTHFNGRAIATVLQTQARLCVWYVEQDTDGRLSRRPFWGRALDYDPSRGLKVWLDGAQSEAECEWVDEGDDWEWETLEQAANRYGAVQLKLKIGDHPLCVRLPFKRPATGAPPTYASGSADAQSGASSRPESPYAFAKKAKLLGGVRAAAEHPPPQHAAPAHAAGLQASSAGVGAREHTQRLAQQAAHHHLDRHLDREMAACAAAAAAAATAPPPPQCARPGSSTGSRSGGGGSRPASSNASPRHRPAVAPPAGVPRRPASMPSSPRLAPLAPPLAPPLAAAVVCGAPAAAPAPFPHGMRMAASALPGVPIRCAQGYVLPYPVSQYPVSQYPAAQYQCVGAPPPAGGGPPPGGGAGGGRGRPPNAAGPNGAALATAAAKRAVRGGGSAGAPAVPSAASSRPLANWNQIIIL